MIRLFQEKDAEPLAQMIAKSLRQINQKDYETAYIERVVESLSADALIKRASWTHFYVAEKEATLVACGAIGPYWDKEDEASLFTIFVAADHQKQGLGSLIMKTLEQDSYFIKSKRIEIPSSITAVAFYQKFGYSIKKGEQYPDKEGLFRLEKHREVI